MCYVMSFIQKKKYIYILTFDRECSWRLRLTDKSSKARFIRRISAVSNAIQTKDNEANHLIIYCLNCIRHGRNATYEPGLSGFLSDNADADLSSPINRGIGSFLKRTLSIVVSGNLNTIVLNYYIPLSVWVLPSNHNFSPYIDRNTEDWVLLSHNICPGRIPLVKSVLHRLDIWDSPAWTTSGSKQRKFD